MNNLWRERPILHVYLDIAVSKKKPFNSRIFQWVSVLNTER